MQGLNWVVDFPNVHGHRFSFCLDLLSRGGVIRATGSRSNKEGCTNDTAFVTVSVIVSDRYVSLFCNCFYI